MSLDRLMDQTGTIVRARETDDGYNGIALDWDNATEVDTPCWVSGGKSSEVTDGRDALVSTRKLYLPAGADITGRDRFRFNGELYLIVGAVTPAARPDRGVHHQEGQLELVSG